MKAARGLILTLLCTVGCALTVPVGSASALPASFGLEGTGAGEFSEPSGIAVDQESGDVYVADEANNRIDKFGPEGEFLLAWGWGVADGKTEALQTCTTTCFAGLPGSGAGQFNGAEGIAVDSSLGFSHGDVYVADTRNDRVEKFGPNGEFLLQFGSEGTGPGQFEALTKHAVAVDQTTGTVYVADKSRVQLFDEAGVVQSQVAFPGAGFSQNLAVDSTGDIYLKSEELPGVRKYDGTGKELPPPRDVEAAHRGASDAITIGPGDELLVNNLGAGEIHHIFAFNTAGAQTASFDAGGEAQDAARGIAYSEHTGALYLINTAANEASVRIVTPPPAGPVVVVGSESAGEIQPTTAKLAATVNPEGAATTYHFEYGTSAAYGESTPVSAPLTAVNEMQSVTVAATGGGFTLAFKGEASGEIPFNAAASEVQAALEGIPALGAGQVAVSGTPGGPWSVEFTGTRAGQNVPELTASPGSLTGPGEPSAVVVTTTPGFSLFDDRAATAPITKLQPGTLYHYRVIATNGTQTTDGPDATFETLPAVSVDSTAVTEVDDQSARLEAELDPHGLASEYRFEYDTTPYAVGEPGHGRSVPAGDARLGPETGGTPVSELIQGLASSTVYHYRVVAKNSLGEVDGPDRSFRTQGLASVLPDGRQWELVSPPNKHGAPLESITLEGGMLQAAADGGALTYVARGPLGEQSKGGRSPEVSQLLSVRGAGTGWSTQDITTPHEELSLLLLSELAEYKLFSDDLTAAVVEPLGATPLSKQTTERTPYRREADGSFTPLVTAANVLPDTPFGGELQNAGTLWVHGVVFVGATPDLSHIVLTSPEALASGFKPGFEPNPEGPLSLYELTDGALTLVSVLPDERPASEELTGSAALGEGTVQEGSGKRGAISSDGTRVFFEIEGELFMRDVPLERTLRLNQVQPDAVGGGSGARFLAASSDGSKVFFTTSSRLTADSTARGTSPDLYVCEITVLAGEPSCTLTDLSVDHTPGEAANVEGTALAVGSNGGRVYFVAKGVLTGTPNGLGEHASPGSRNLYVYDTGARKIQLVAVLSDNDPKHESLVQTNARVSPDGRYFAFMSQRSLTGYDNRDAASGQSDAEAYLFDADSGVLRCVSCDPSGARPHGVFDLTGQLLADQARSWTERWIAGFVPGWTAPGVTPTTPVSYQSRYLSDSGRMFFDSSDGLVAQDKNGVMDAYEFEPPGVGSCTTAAASFSAVDSGCVSLLSSGTSPAESVFLDASENGDDAFLLTGSRLTKSDVDGALDVYDAHVCSASSPCPPAASSIPACEGDSCQNPSPPPNDSTPGSLTYQGPGNLMPPTIKPMARPKAKRLTRAQKLTKALKACHVKRGKGRRACERTARKNYGPIKPTAKSRTRKGAK